MTSAGFRTTAVTFIPEENLGFRLPLDVCDFLRTVSFRILYVESRSLSLSHTHI